MPNKRVIHLQSTFKAKEQEDGSVKIVGLASTDSVDRVGDVILPEAWEKSGGLNNYKKNPILLFNHNYNSPIGKVNSINVTERGLEVEGSISAADTKVKKLVEDGVLSAFSVGFAMKEVDYVRETDGFLIKDAELYEISVVSVPANQDAVFSLAKSFDSDKEFNEFKKQHIEPPEEKSKVKTEDPNGERNEEIEMTKEELQELIDNASKHSAEAVMKAQKDLAKLQADEKAAKEQADKDFEIKVTSTAEKLLADVEKRFKEKNESFESIIGDLKEDLKSKSEEIEAMRTSKRVFSDRGSSDWKKEYTEDIVNAGILGTVTKKGWETKAGKNLMKAVSDISGVEVSSGDFEQIVSTNIERDIELELVLAPLFRELPMSAYTMIMPIMPDAGYAEFVARGDNGTQTAPKGNLDQRSATYGDNAGVALSERVVTTNKIMSTSYLGKDTEEDAILPILPLIREAMVRSHARSIEQSLLLGNSAQGVYTSGIYDGLTEMAVDASTDANLGASGFDATTSVVTAADLFALRKSMGKYGLRPSDVVFIVSLDAYYNLIEDAEFEDVNLVANQATKLTGQVGSVYGTRVIISDEFPAKAAAAYCAACVNVRNFLRPRLRGLNLETEYSVINQNTALVASQRAGFIDIIEDATAVATLQWELT